MTGQLPHWPKELDARAAEDMRRMRRARGRKVAPMSRERHAIAGKRMRWWAWWQRRCFICGVPGQCPHREPEVELAYLEVMTRHRTEAKCH